MIERRSIPVEIRADSDNERRFRAVVMRYDAVDAYGTIWSPGVFARSLAERLPRIVWAHDMTDPIGRYVEYEDSAESLTLVGELDDFDAVPRARQAAAQLRSGTIDQFSVGFIRGTYLDRGALSAEDLALGASERITQAELPETSLVVTGAVPGTHLISVRSAAGNVPSDFVIALGAKIASGAITKEQAAHALALVAEADPAAAAPHDLDPDTVLAMADLDP